MRTILTTRVDINAVNNSSQLRFTPARQSQRPSTISNAQVRAGSVLAEQPRTAVQVLTPPDSSFTDQHGPASCSKERDVSSDLEPGYSGSAVPQVVESTRELHLDPGSAQGLVPEIVESSAPGNTTIENVAGDNNEVSSRIGRPQRNCKQVPKVLPMTDHVETENVQQSGGASTPQNSPTRMETGTVQNMETRARTAIALRRRTTSVLPNEAEIVENRHVTNKDTEQRRRTTSTLPDEVNIDPRLRAGSSIPVMPQRITRANIYHLEHEPVLGNADGSADGYDGPSESRAEEAAGQDTSLMTMHEEEEREELFERLSERPSRPPGEWQQQGKSIARLCSVFRSEPEQPAE